MVPGSSCCKGPRDPRFSLLGSPQLRESVEGLCLSPFWFIPGSGFKDFTQEKSVFCRIRGGPDRDLGPRYQPFRLTPYLTKIKVSDGAPAQPCCLLIAERVHSGYEGAQARAWPGGSRKKGALSRLTVGGEAGPESGRHDPVPQNFGTKKVL